MSIEQSKGIDSVSSDIERQKLLTDIVSKIETKFGKLPSNTSENLAALPKNALQALAGSIDDKTTSFDELMAQLKSAEHAQFAAILSDDTNSA